MHNFGPEQLNIATEKIKTEYEMRATEHRFNKVDKECTGSICVAYGLEPCQCRRGPHDPVTKACELCCKFPGDDYSCKSSFDWNFSPYDVPDLFAKPGTPCDNYSGYCDVFQKCRELVVVRLFGRQKNSVKTVPENSTKNKSLNIFHLCSSQHSKKSDIQSRSKNSNFALAHASNYQKSTSNFVRTSVSSFSQKHQPLLMTGNGWV
ncbi:Disintegrin and metalloproteinase domain-containing protein 10, partial [Stegodyphus mimosarum]